MTIAENDDITASGRSIKRSEDDKSDDRFIIKALDSKDILMAVADGMGGHPAGDVAAQDVIDSLILVTGDTENNVLRIVSAIDRADRHIRNRVRKAMILEGMGTTATAVIVNQRKLWWGHVGDSRLYLFRGGILRQITKDHTFLQEYIDSGELSATKARSHPMAHVLDQCVGGLDSGADCGSFHVLPGDIILLCTDGLNRVVNDQQIESLITSATSANSCVEDLLAAAAEEGLSDDTTVVVAYISPSQGRIPAEKRSA
jgi:protein phosphatase